MSEENTRTGQPCSRRMEEGERKEVVFRVQESRKSCWVAAPALRKSKIQPHSGGACRMRGPGMSLITISTSSMITCWEKQSCIRHSHQFGFQARNSHLSMFSPVTE